MLVAVCFISFTFGVSVCARSATVNNRFSVQVFMIVFIIMKGHQSVNQNIHSFKKRSAEEIFIEINKCHNLMLCALITCAHTSTTALKRSTSSVNAVSFLDVIFTEKSVCSSHSSIRRKQICILFPVSFLFIGKHLEEEKNVSLKYTQKRHRFDFCIHN